MKSKYTFRKLLFSISAAFVFQCLPQTAKASHAAGAEITYRHIAGNMYRLHLTFYRDCYGISAPVTADIHAQATSCGINTTYFLPRIAGTGTEITLHCSSASSVCIGGSTPGFQKWEYELDITIPAQCSDWIFSFTHASRNGGTTIQSGSSLYVESHLDNSVHDNSSPQFTNDPLMFACTSQPFHYNNGMVDPDGDSLVYHLVDAIGAIYLPGYSGQQPFTSVPPVTLDSFTGDYFMQPAAPESGPVAFEIRDYRNGMLMGSVIREIMISTFQCTNQIPTETGMNGTAQQIAYVLPGDTICFDIFSDDTDSINVLTMTWNHSIPAATFDTSGTPHPTGTFCWIPSPADVRAQPYLFTSLITDDNCPIRAAGVYSFFIYVTLDTALVFMDAENAEENVHLLIAPNPSGGVFRFQNKAKFTLIKIYNSLGECILQKDFEEQIDLSGRPDGIYFLEAITIDGKTARQKVVLSR